MKYCNDCGQNVLPTKKFSIVWFLINCLWLVGGIVYIVYYFAFKKKTCPLCGGTNFGIEHIGNNDLDAGDPKPSALEKLGNKIDEANIYAKEKHEESQIKLDHAQVKLQTAKDTTAETLRKRKAGELDWQIAKAEKKAAKQQN